MRDPSRVGTRQKPDSSGEVTLVASGFRTVTVRFTGKSNDLRGANLSDLLRIDQDGTVKRRERTQSGGLDVGSFSHEELHSNGRL